MNDMKTSSVADIYEIRAKANSTLWATLSLRSLPGTPVDFSSFLLLLYTHGGLREGVFFSFSYLSRD